MRIEQTVPMQAVIEEIWQARMQILRGEDYSCPLSLTLFFDKYARAVTPATQPIPRQVRTTRSELPNACFGSVIACSVAGADSALMKYLMPEFRVMEINEGDWRELPKFHKREFQIGLHAMSGYYSCVYLGISDYDEPESEADIEDPYQFEYTTTFVDLWNRYMPTKMFHPLRYLSRLDIYQRLLAYGHDLETICPCTTERAYCGNCLKCFIHYLMVKHLRGTTRLPPPTLDVIDRARAEWSHDQDYFDVKKHIRQMGLGAGPDFTVL